LTQSELKPYDSDEVNLLNFIDPLKRRKNLIIRLFVIISFINIFYVSYKRIFNPTYSGSFSILVKLPSISPFKFDDTPTMNRSTYRVGALNTIDEKPTLFAVLKSPIVLGDLSKKYNLSNKQLASMIKISIGKNENKMKTKGIIDIKLETQNAEQGKLILNDLQKTYIDYSLMQNRNKLYKGLKFVENKISSIDENLNNSNNQISIFQEKYNLIDPEVDAEYLKEKIQNTESKINDLNLQIDILNELEQNIQKRSVSITEFTSDIDKTGNASLIIKSSELKDSGAFSIENELSKAKLKFRPNSQFIISLSRRLEEVKPDIIKRQLNIIKSAKKNLKDEILANKEALSKKNNEFQKMPRIIKEFVSIKNENVLLNKIMKDAFMEKEKIMANIKNDNPPWVALNRPFFDTKPSKPEFFKDIIMGSLLGLFFSSLVGYILDKKENKYFSSKDLIKDNGLKLISEITLKSDLKLLTEEVNLKYLLNRIEKDDPNVKLPQESVEFILAELNSFKEKEKFQTFSIASSENSERIDFIFLYCLILLSRFGQKVLVIDLDIKPNNKLDIFGVKNKKGIFQYIHNETKLNEIIYSIPYLKNSYYVSLGSNSESSSIIFSYQINKLISEIKQTKDFDFILFKSPSIQDSLQGIEIQKSVDATILQVTLGKSTKDIVVSSLEILEKNKCNIIGFLTLDHE